MLENNSVRFTCGWAGIRCVRVFQAATRRGSQPPQSHGAGGVLISTTSSLSTESVSLITAVRVERKVGK